MTYFTLFLSLSHQNLSKDVQDFHAFLLEKKVTVGDLWKLLRNYERDLAKKDTHIELYPYLRKCFARSVSDSLVASTYEDGTDGQSHSAVDGVIDGAHDGTSDGTRGGPNGCGTQDGGSFSVDIENEPLGCAPGEANIDVSPDYRMDTP